MDVELLKKLSEACGVSGFEGEVREIAKKEIERHVTSIKADNMGNLIAFRKGTSKSPKKIAFIAHMDEIGFIVKRFSGGFIDFTKIGGIDDRILLSQKVLVKGEKVYEGVIGSKPIHLQKKDEREKLMRYDEMYIDLGIVAKKKKKGDGGDEEDEGEEKLKIEKGSPISFAARFTKIGETTYCGKSLDNRLGVYSVIELAKTMKKSKNDLYFVFSTQEEVGLKGARTAAYSIEPDLAIIIDTTIAGDVPAVSKKESELALGNGASISLVESGGQGAIIPEHLKKYLIDLARKNKIKYQIDVLEGGMTDTAIVQLIKGGILSCALGIPVRNVHTPFEIFDSRDLEEVIKLARLASEEWK